MLKRPGNICTEYLSVVADPALQAAELRWTHVHVHTHLHDFIDILGSNCAQALRTSRRGKTGLALVSTSILAHQAS